MWAGFTTLVGGELEILEAPTWDNQSGTKAPIINRKRETSMTSSGLLEDQAQAGFVASNNIILNPTTVAGGTSIQVIYAWGERGRFLAGNARDEWELILKSDTQYAAVFTAIGGGNKAQILLDWYEHSDLH